MDGLGSLWVCSQGVLSTTYRSFLWRSLPPLECYSGRASPPPIPIPQPPPPPPGGETWPFPSTLLGVAYLLIMPELARTSPSCIISVESKGVLRLIHHYDLAGCFTVTLIRLHVCFMEAVLCSSGNEKPIFLVDCRQIRYFQTSHQSCSHWCLPSHGAISALVFFDILSS